MGYMVSQKGGYDKVGFTSKYLHNHISKTRRGKVKDGDAFATLAYLLSKADSDLLFLGKFTLKDGRLDSLVWVDGASVVDYECFGDVLAFDTTYKKNVYNKPLVIFSGTNHHGQTTIFGCAMLLDERSETFKWALKKFLEIMSEKPPGGVVTDGDHATRGAILEVFPGIPHHLCARHLHRNAVQNIKNKHFWDDFNILLYGQCTVQIFEERWSEIISKYGLAENEWVQGIYNDKMKWATTYLREHFFGRIRATSQCEEIHSLLKNYVDSKTSLLEFMHKCSEVLRHYQNNHLTANFETFYKFSVLTTCLESFEKQAAELYTRNIFKLVKDEIEAAGALNVTECPNSGDIVELFETRGLPCSHIFGVLKYRNTKCVPSSLILKRWTRDAKSDFICSIGEQDSADDIVPTLRCAYYREISGELLKLISKVQNKSDAQARLSPTSALIGDPAVVKSKGAPKKVPIGQKRQKCSHCKSSMHFVRTCPLLVKEDSPAEYSNAEDEPMGGGSKKSVSKLTETPKIRANGKKSRQKIEEIILTQEILKDKTNTLGIEVVEVPDAAITNKPGDEDAEAVVHPYQPYSGVLPIPFHHVPNGMAYFNQYPSTTRITSYPQFFHVSSYSSGPSNSNTWAGLLNGVINNRKP
ncbi:protein FAR1-RELATED SEQUENCE 5-like [Arachis duranensis]|uniref:Protein FAR1-RELATED SEQUENCE 5-like n=1 Tax=Arachis duranensis TaxID=130453 RepID=A0A6P4DRY1_ARADU|nr:protein FAR1-RELATED SEQUENCE 5-like [Arachis duranensis]